MMIDLIGQQIGNYQIVRLLGSGTFGMVYLGQHVRITTKQAAIKVLYLMNVDLKKFQQEAEIMAMLGHPHIIHIEDCNFYGSMPFLIMDYAPGGSLRDRHPKETQVPLATVVRYIKELAEMLQNAHDNDIVHRDIKPENILIGRVGELRLSDFGIALISQTGRTTLTTPHFGGTPHYMAPEQCRGESPTRATDQYALAVMAYEWLTGKPPFNDGAPIQILYQHTHEPVQPLRSKLPALPADVEQVILKALSKDPKARFNNVMAFANALAHTSNPQTSVISPAQNVATTTMVAPDIPAQPATAKSPARKLLFTCSGHSAPIHRVIWSFDSTRLASASDDETVRVWNARTGEMLFICAIGNNRRPSPYDQVPTRRQTVGSTQNTPAPKSHNGPVYDIAYSPDGTILASGSADTTVGLWDARDGQLLCSCVGHTAPINCVIWSGSDYVYSASDDNTLSLWRKKDGVCHTIYQGHTAPVKYAALEDFGSLYSASIDAKVCMWMHSSGGPTKQEILTHQATVNHIAWAPDKKYLASASDDTSVGLYYGLGTKSLKGHTQAVTRVAWAPNSRHLASASNDATVHVWDTGNTTAKLLYACKGHTGAVYDIAWSLDGRLLASSSEDGTVRLWEGSSGQLLHTYTEHTGPVRSIAWCRDSRRYLLASASDDGTVRVWQA